LSGSIKIPQIFFLLIQLPKFKPISFLEIYPKQGSQYVHSSGSKSFITKIDIKTNLAIIKLPSGVHKIFSIYSIGSLGQTLFLQKKLKTRSNAGFFKKIGKKSLSRGVAKNPVDHPHGGRNKAIRYQRTP
jgi:large subunit ribosomal protein L2